MRVDKEKMKPIKVMHISNIEKSNYYLNNLCDFTDRKLINFSFVTFAKRAGFVEDLEKRGCNSYALDAMERSKYPKAIKKLWKILKIENPDIVHLHLFDPTVIGLTLAKLQKRKTILTRHHSDAIHQLPPMKKRFYLMLENYINKNVDFIIAPSQMVRDILVKWENVPENKIAVIPYGQTMERFDRVTPEKINETKKALNIREDHLTLVCNSRLYHRKGHKYLFEAIAPLTKNGLKIKLFLVGEGTYKAELEKMAKDLQISDYVYFLGWRDDALEIMACADIIVHPSLEDALSSAVIESLMLEKPIIATDISGVRDSLHNGDYGTIVPPADANAFRAALEETIKNLDVAREKAKGGRKHIMEYMDAKKVAEQYTKCYQKLMNS